MKKESVEEETIDASTIVRVLSRQVLDSRGNPTVETDITLRKGASGRGTVPSGASTGVHEALELRDDKKTVYGGKSVMRAVANVNKQIGPKLLGRSALDQQDLDTLMLKLDGTRNKSNLGANAVLSVSMAVARAAAASRNESLFRYISKKKEYKLPIPMMNVINGGEHAGNNLAIQEFLIEPVGGKNFMESLRYGVEVYHSLKIILKEKYGVSATNVGDEGGYAPPLEKTVDALDSILAAIRVAGYDESQIRLGLDAASSTFYDPKTLTYKIDGRIFSAGELDDYYTNLVSTYPILTLEDPYAEEAFEDSARLTAKLGRKVKIIGDDLYVTNAERLAKGIQMKSTNAILIKLNQIGTLTETIETIRLAKSSKFTIAVSHRSGETEDTFISHLATAVGSHFIKTGAPARGERTAKYNELIRISEELGSEAQYAGSQFV
ncbi:MAG: phosphopyruvate hydratase [Nitrososphaerota archaeon]|nr:phosphopyruvate hydratase [Nitrososphaerota archaeon]MDG6921725.1 phosphopyruvate hydratase [Nitrososphaerota archaeon]